MVHSREAPEEEHDERYYIFGSDEAVRRMASDFDVPVIAEIPLVAAVGEHSDAGTPIALGDTVSAQSFAHLARMVIDAVDRRNRELPPTEAVNVHKKQ